MFPVQGYNTPKRKQENYTTNSRRRVLGKRDASAKGRYLTTIRLNAVRKLLETTDKLVSEIAAETGFFDQSHLTKIFKRERGITPGEYRRHHRANG